MAPATRKRSKPFAFSVAVFLALSFTASALAQNIHFLDRNGGEARRALRDLEARAKADPTADTLADLGWAQLLYACSAADAGVSFRGALEREPAIARRARKVERSAASVSPRRRPGERPARRPPCR